MLILGHWSTVTSKGLCSSLRPLKNEDAVLGFVIKPPVANNIIQPFIKSKVYCKNPKSVVVYNE